ncbi:ABC transporter ATP-binding protein [Ruminococcus flavefaciens]|uniref:ABC-2 type transport system ATP-binding protein n=1 Tax=Ruminococcus flavefaciens TaxID=1265 RepID=A0A1M7HGY2_RUMFL|nr:ABC transporter ATP-binding protein [Ruminococcus flavefaciens]SHM27417.1 ABC-2 type transport system ATP-binding protein [Ruminococcus flavefaciens]
MNVLEVKELKKSFGSKKVLDGVSFDVPENCVFGFIGRNGAGKTTTMRAVLGLLKADGGEINVCGEKVSYGCTPKGGCIGFLPDVPEFYGYMNAVEYLTLCGEISGMDRKKLKARISELLELVGLDKEKHRIKGYSRGMKQRLGIVQALINRPKLLICDEPTSALDPVGRKDILDIISAAKEYTSVVFSTHILSDVERVCSKVAFLEGGKTAFFGSLEDIRALRSDTALELTLVCPNDIEKVAAAFPEGKETDGRFILPKASEKDCAELMAFLSAKMIPIKRLERHEADLEDLFLEVIGK